jgi:peptidoglycan hydrolase FlgJ
MTGGAASAAAGAGQRLASDPASLDGLKARAKSDPRGAARDVATLFEGLFLQEMLKRMRAASLDSSLDNEASKMGTEMLDSQLAMQLAGKPGGLADIVARQLEQQLGALPVDPAAAAAAGSATPPAPAKIPERAAAAFVQQHSATAQAVEARTGIPATFMIAQAGHETGWGQRGIVGRDGTASNNLFGIKAGAGWSGPTVDVLTTEYRNGEPTKVVQRFRAYASTADSFADYARLVGSSPRYAAVRAATGDAQQFAQGLQKAGYATDPAYADKLARAINTTLQLQRALG